MSPTLIIAFDLYRPWFGAGRTLAGAAALAALAAWMYARTARDLGIGVGEALPRARRNLLIVLRIAALGVLAWALWGPSAAAGRPRQPMNVPVVVMADRSASMAAPDVGPSPPAGSAGQGAAPAPLSRWDAAKAWLGAEPMRRLDRVADVRALLFDGQLRPFDLGRPPSDPPVGEKTDLFGLLAACLQGDHRVESRGSEATGVVLVLSDGHDTVREQDPGLAAQLSRGRWRLYAVPLGAPSDAPDLALLAHAAADVIFDGQSTRITATVTQTGYDQADAEVDLFHDGALEGTQRVRFLGAGARQVQFKVQPAAANNQNTLHGYRVAVRKLHGEQTDENNARWVFIQANRDRIKVALFEGQPTWDTRFLAQLLRDDAQVELTTVFGLGAKRLMTGGRPASGDARELEAQLDPDRPTAEALNRFDVIILGKGVEQFFGGERAQLLVDFVSRRGGALVLARGKPFDESPANPRAAEARAAQRLLAPVEPVDWGVETVRDLALKLTPSGQESPLLRFEQAADAGAVLTQLPDMLAATRIEREKSASIVLLRQESREPGQAPMAAVAHLHTAGGGQVFAILSEGLWRWAFLPPAERRLDGAYASFWSRTVRWLATGGEFLPGQAVSLHMDRLSFAPGQVAEIQVVTRFVEDRDFKPTLRVIGPDGVAVPIPLAKATAQSSRYVGSFTPRLPGVHRVELDTPGLTPDKHTTRFAVYDPLLERLNTAARPGTLLALAEATGGECLKEGDQERFVAAIARLKQEQAGEPRQEYAFNQAWVLAALLTALGLEWSLRRWWGML